MLSAIKDKVFKSIPSRLDEEQVAHTQFVELSGNGETSVKTNRKLMQKNKLASKAHQQHERHLVREQRYKAQEMAREETEVRLQLDRLHREQAALTTHDLDADDIITFVDSISTTPVSSDIEDENQPFINPYPVTFSTTRFYSDRSTSRITSRPSTGKNNATPRQCGRGSVELEDMEQSNSSSKITLPQLTLSRQLHRSGSLSTIPSSNNLPIKAVSTSSLKHESIPGDRQEALVPSVEPQTRVRLPQKKGALRRLDLKTGNMCDSPQSAVKRWRDLSRSQSLKEHKKALCAEPPANFNNATQILRSRSLKIRGKHPRYNKHVLPLHGVEPDFQDSASTSPASGTPPSPGLYSRCTMENLDQAIEPGSKESRKDSVREQMSCHQENHVHGAKPTRTKSLKGRTIQSDDNEDSNIKRVYSLKQKRPESPKLSFSNVAVTPDLDNSGINFRKLSLNEYRGRPETKSNIWGYDQHIDHINASINSRTLLPKLDMTSQAKNFV